ncbi:hypothetical protein [Sphaerisporangium corydalis]|uniref:Uncharacterized protein n=1 Tax=Sphaerisporangium corydalis TaxID=1441875 RepID=A0ABV9E9I6_9ACTN|nr:hypothetical protein [Sphaerisporangium corydalis]
MRHFLGLLIGVVVTAVLLAGAGWASQDAVRGLAGGATVDPINDSKALIGLGAMLLAGLVLGLVVAGRVSPLATFVPSMALLAWTVIYALDTNRALGLAPVDPAMNPMIVQAGRGMQDLLGRGIFAMLGIALFVPVLMPSRWAGRQQELEEVYEEEAPDTSRGYY